MRYAFSAAISKAGGGEPEAWDVPFRLDERKIPRLGAGQSVSIGIDPALLPFYLGRLRRAGFAAKEIRFEAAIEPKEGDQSLSKAASVLPLTDR